MEFRGRDYYENVWGRVQKIVMLSSFPVAVKMLESAEMLNDIEDDKGRPIRLVDPKIAPCQLMAQARFWGTVRGGTANALSLCAGGSAYMGFAEMPKGRMMRYPTVWQHINSGPGGQIGAALEGKGLYPKEERPPTPKPKRPDTHRSPDLNSKTPCYISSSTLAIFTGCAPLY